MGQERAGVKTEIALTNVKINVSVRAFGATLLIFKKVFPESSDLPPLFLRISEGTKCNPQKGNESNNHNTQIPTLMAYGAFGYNTNRKERIMYTSGFV
jgi:hypothetical protein